MDTPCLLSLVRWIDSIEEDKEFVCPFFVFGLMREGFGGGRSGTNAFNL